MIRRHPHAILIGTTAERTVTSLPTDAVGAPWWDTDESAMYRWNGTAWVSVGGGASELGDLTDVTIDGTPAQGEILMADGSDGWDNKTKPEAGIIGTDTNGITATGIGNSVPGSSAVFVFQRASDGAMRYCWGDRLKDAHETDHDDRYYTEAEIDAMVGAKADDPHGSDHLDGGSDEVDGDKIEISRTATNYTPATDAPYSTATGQLTSHLKGIDDALTAGGTLVEIASYKLTSDGTFSFTSIPGTYKDLILTASLRSDRSSNEVDAARMTVNSLTTGYYDYQYSYASDTSIGGDAARAQDEIGGGVCDTSTARANSFTPFFARFFNYADTDFETFVQLRSCYMGDLTADTDIGEWFAVNRCRATAAITSIQLYPAVGTDFLADSMATLYGVL